MGGVKDALFGSTKEPKVKLTNMYTGEQNELLNSLVSMLGGELGQGADPYTGELSPGASDIQSQVFGVAGDALGKINGQDYGQNTRSLIEQLLSGGRSMDATTPGAVGTERNAQAQAYDPAADEEYWTKAFLDPAMKQWSERVAPAVQEKFIANNIASSSGANTALSRSAGDMMTNLTGQLASIMQGNKSAADTRAFTGEETYLNRVMGTGENEAARQMAAQNLNANLGENALQRQMSIPGFELNLKQTEDPTEQLLNMLGIGNMQRTIAQQGDQAGYQQWLAQQPYSNPWLQYMGLNAGTSPYQATVMPGSQTNGLVQSLLAPLGMGFMQGGGLNMFSSGGGGGIGTNSSSYMNNAGMYGAGGTY